MPTSSAIKTFMLLFGVALGLMFGFAVACLGSSDDDEYCYGSGRRSKVVMVAAVVCASPFHAFASYHAMHNRSDMMVWWAKRAAGCATLIATLAGSGYCISAEGDTDLCLGGGAGVGLVFLTLATSVAVFVCLRVARCKKPSEQPTEVKWSSGLMFVIVFATLFAMLTAGGACVSSRELCAGGGRPAGVIFVSLAVTGPGFLESLRQRLRNHSDWLGFFILSIWVAGLIAMLMCGGICLNATYKEGEVFCGGGGLGAGVSMVVLASVCLIAPLCGIGTIFLKAMSPHGNSKSKVAATTMAEIDGGDYDAGGDDTSRDSKADEGQPPPPPPPIDDDDDDDDGQFGSATPALYMEHRSATG